MRPRVSTVSRQNSRNCPPTRRQIDAIWAACGIGVWFDLFWSCFHLVWYCEKWIEMAGRARWQTIWMMTLHYGSVSLAAMLLMFADLMDLNGHILRLVDVLDIQTSSISSWFVFLRPLRTSTLRSLVTWLQKDRRQVEGHFDIKTKHLPSFCHYAAAWWAGRQIERFLYVRISRIDFLFPCGDGMDTLEYISNILE